MFKLLISLSYLAASTAQGAESQNMFDKLAQVINDPKLAHQMEAVKDENRVFREYVRLVNSKYVVDSHNVETSDGFVLKVFNVKGDGSEVSRNGPGKPKPVVFLQHGLMACSETFVQNGENSLAFKLVKAGYDVWLGNNRGNIYSRKNIHLKAWGKKYFNFSFYEMGELDLPAMIDYTLKSTGQKKLSYIAHSLGTTQMFSALALNQGALHEKLNVFIAMAPVVQLSHTSNEFFIKTAADTDSIQWWLDKFGIHELFGPQWQSIKKGVCWMKKSWCDGKLEQLDVRKQKFDTDRIPAQEQTLQNSVSSKLIAHLGQIINRNKFELFDYTSWNAYINQHIYGSKTPPLIPVDLISEVPTIVYAGLKDEIVAMEDAEWIKDNVKTVEEFIKLDIYHSGYMFESDQSFYDGIFNRLDKHNGIKPEVKENESMNATDNSTKLTSSALAAGETPIVKGTRMSLVQTEAADEIVDSSFGHDQTGLYRMLALLINIRQIELELFFITLKEFSLAQVVRGKQNLQDLLETDWTPIMDSFREKSAPYFTVPI